MSSDKRFSLLLQGALLGVALVAATACGNEASPTGSSTSNADEGDDDQADDDRADDTADDEADDTGDDDDTAMVIDASKPIIIKDSAVPKPPASDAGPAKDAGPILGVDAGLKDGGDVTPPSGNGYTRGEAPTQASASTKGPYSVKTYTSGYRDGPAYADSTIHYPEGAEAPYTIVAVVPGFVSPQSSIQPWGPFLASHGIVTITIGTNSPGDLPDARAAALLDALKTLESEHARSGSPLEGKLDLKRQATMGWSMGGGGTLLAAETKQDLKATISLAAWNPGYQYAKIKSPALMFAATSDALAGGQSQGFYASIPDSTPKMLWEAQGQSHGFANNPSAMSGVVGRYGLSWMKNFLEEDTRYLQFLKADKPAGTTGDFKHNLK